MDQGKMRPARQLDWSDVERRTVESRAGRSGATVSAGALRALRRIRAKRAFDGQQPRAFCGQVALASLRLEGLQLSREQVIQALARHGVHSELRSRLAQMIRNHVAIQRAIELTLRRQIPLSPHSVLGWYASLSGGLPLPSPAAHTLQRLQDVCRRVNSPPMHLPSAVSDVASLYCEILSDPLVPSYNGVLARLMMGFHLGRCGLPPVILDDQLGREIGPQRAYHALLDLLEARAREATQHTVE